MKNYNEGLYELAKDNKLVNAILNHSENLECEKNWWYSNQKSDYILDDKFHNDPFPKLSLFDWSNLSGTQILISIDTPIARVK